LKNQLLKKSCVDNDYKKMTFQTPLEKNQKQIVGGKAGKKRYYVLM